MKLVEHHNQSGYILLLTLLMLSASVAVVSYIFINGSTYTRFAQTVIDREKAKLIALGGIQVAIAQLSHQKDIKVPEKKEGEQSIGKKNTDQEDKYLLEQILPTINRWQNFSLTYNVDGIDAQLNVCLMCEDGKININHIYDFKTKKFIGQGKPNGDWKKLLEAIFKQIQIQVGGTNLFAAFEKFLKERQYKLHDVTELLHIKEFEVFKYSQFYDPPQKTDKKNKKRSIYLTDLFTTHSTKASLQPWLFSDSILGVLQLKQAQPNDIQNRKQKMSDWLKNFKRFNQWKQAWKTTLSSLYEKELQSLPKGIESMLNNTFTPQIFSVLVESEIGLVKQRLFSILERIKSVQDGNTVYNVKIKKLYWL